MDPVSMLVAAIGIGSSIYGGIQQTTAAKSVASLQAQQAQLQTQQAGLEQQYTAQQRIVSQAQYGQQVAQINANKAVIGLQQQQENVRQSAMNIDAQRQKRQAIRDQLAASALGIARGANSGGSLTDSGVQGGQAQISNQGRYNLLGINQAQRQGNDIFELNRQITGVNLGLQDQSLGFLNTSYNAQQQGFNIQSQMYGLTGQISALNSQIAGYQGQAATGQAFSSLGNSILGNTGTLTGLLKQGGSILSKLA